MGAKLWRHLRPDAEPALEARHRLVQQHAEPIDGAVAARPARRQEAAFRAGYRRCRRRSASAGSAARSMSSGGFPVMPRLVALTSSPQPASACVPLLPGDHLDPLRRSLPPRPSPGLRVRLASRIFEAPASISPYRMARAAPPAPSTSNRPLALVPVRRLGARDAS